MDIIEVTLKLLMALALGGLIGLERESSHKPAGFRTNILICVGAAMMMILAGLLFDQNGQNGNEVARIAAGVITGIGFIGAGTIIQSGGSIIGITTAATIWAVAVLGLVIGSGYYLVALIFSGIVILTLIFFRRLEEKPGERLLYHYQLKTKTAREVLLNIKKLALHEGIKFKEITHKKDGPVSVISFSFPSSEEKEQEFNQSLMSMDGILEIKID
ncbi:MAG: MgtC/SapB family protein [Candidatus Aminicenantes bacterium]|nr:MgtC/SapB family protein [Candidatus Aminicenantes bacterium]